MAVTPKYTKQLVVMVTPAMRDQLDKIADEREVSLAQVAREALEQGLTEPQ
jgi:predicted transcriptional regulator